MQTRSAVACALLCTTFALIFASPARAQLKRRLERCLPYPTLQEEIAEMNAEVEEKERRAAIMAGYADTHTSAPPERKVIIDDVEFAPPTSLPESTRAEIAADLKADPLSPRSYDKKPGGSSEFEEAGVRGAFQDRGYFKVLATAEVRSIRSDAEYDHVAVTIHAEEGPQYRLGKVRFRTADPEETLAFPKEVLRAQLALGEGDIFNVTIIRLYLERLRKFYASQGYIDFTPEPQTDIDDSTQRINLTFVFAQEKQYRLGKIEVFGPNRKIEDVLKSQFKSGEVFDSIKLDRVLQENKSALPSDMSPEDVILHKNVKAGTVDLWMDFQTCPDDPE